MEKIMILGFDLKEYELLEFIWFSPDKNETEEQYGNGWCYLWKTDSDGDGHTWGDIGSDLIITTEHMESDVVEFIKTQPKIDMEEIHSSVLINWLKERA